MESVADLVSKLTIRAPVAGLIAQRSAEIGSVVTEGTALFTMIDDSDSVYVIVPVAESDAPFVQQGQAARVFVRSLAEQEFAGVVAVVSPVLDPASGNRTIRVRVDSSDPRLLPGLFARVQIPVGTAVSVPVIPHAAIRNRQDDVAEVLELNGNRVFRREIRIRETEAGDGALLAVVDGLNAGARIVMRPGDNLRDGTEVRDAR